MKTIEIQLFRFEELSEDAQAFAIQKYYEKEDYPFLKDELIEELSFIDKDRYFSNVELCYSLSHSQGDGLSFSSNFDFEKWIKNTNYNQFIKNAIKKLIYNCYTKKNLGRYAYASESDLIFDFDYSNKKYENLDALIEIEIKKISEYYMNICNKLEALGYSILDYRMCKQEFAEFANDNDYYYYPTGELYGTI